LYENFFYGYTKKQWGVEPRELPAAILQRLPVRFNYDDNYYQQRYQGIPIEGYTSIVQKILDHPGIEVHLGRRLQAADATQFDYLFWSGPLDAYFEHELGRLQYRSLVFERFDAEGDYQGNAVINYCQESVPWTRIAEHKHFAPWEEHDKTVCFREYSKLADGEDIPYYPLRLQGDKSLLQEYMNLAQKTKNVTFIGRLGTYRYLDMHVVIGESLDLAKLCLSADFSAWPKFSGKPL
jgi:UDP-galactopyranose mutase